MSLRHRLRLAPESLAQANRQSSAWPWLAAALIAHTFWGAYPALGRYLQTMSNLPSMSLLVVGYLPMLILMFVYVLPRFGVSIFRSRVMWGFALVVVARSITNILAARFTLALYVQLITLMTPFIVALLSAFLLRQRLPAFTLRAMLLSLFGSVLMMSGEISAQGVRFALTTSDLLGMGLALLSALFLALYMLSVRHTVHFPAPGHVVLLFQGSVIALAALPLSLLAGETWARWSALGRNDWLVVIAYWLFVILGANGFQVASLRHLGAPIVSSLMGWRLVSALLLGMALLGEGLQSAWQALGMVVVLATVTWYLRQRPAPSDD